MMKISPTGTGLLGRLHDTLYMEAPNIKADAQQMLSAIGYGMKSQEDVDKERTRKFNSNCSQGCWALYTH